MNKCKVIAIANRKGGTTKSTSTLNIGIGLARQGKKVLLLDLDSQGDLTASPGWRDGNSLNSTVTNLMEDVIEGKETRESIEVLSHCGRC